MKQLLLNFLFFVGAAAIFFQCAKLFPSEVAKNRQPVVNSKNVTQKHNRKTGVSQYFTGKYIFRPNSRTGVIISYIGNGVFPLNMFRYINSNPFAVNRNFGFNYTDIYVQPLYPNPGFSYTQLLTAQTGDDLEDYPENVK